MVTDLLPPHWEPIISTISWGFKLAEKLYLQLETKGENGVMADEILQDMKVLQRNFNIFAAGSKSYKVPEIVAEQICTYMHRINKQIESTSKLKEAPIISFVRAKKINEALKDIKQSLLHLDLKLSTFGLIFDFKKEQALKNDEMMDRLENISQNADWEHNFRKFREVTAVKQHNSTVGSTVESISSFGSSPDVSDEAEFDQIEAFSNIPSLIKQIETAKMEEKYKQELISVLNSSTQSWRYPLEDIKIEKVKGQNKLISSGGFKNVFQGTLILKKSEKDIRGLEVPVAVLQYNITGRDLNAKRGNILREIYFSWKLVHPCVVNTYGAFWPDEDEEGIPPKILSELMTHNLSSAIKEVALSEPKARFAIALDIAEAIYFLHSNHFVHQDLKPENVLLRIEGDEVLSRAKVCDFGTTKEIRSTIIQKTQIAKEFTPMYAPPEQFTGTRPNYSYDLWSYGVLLCFLDGDPRKTPYITQSNIQALASNGSLLKEVKKWVSSIDNPVLKECADKCTNREPKKRGKISDVLSFLNAKETFVKNQPVSVVFHKAHTLYKKSKYDDAMKILSSESMKDFPDALYLRGVFYENGHSVNQDYSYAAKFYKDAADLENARAQNRLGNLYIEGKGVVQSYEAAVEQFTVASNQGFAPAQNNLGLCYQYGVGVDQDYDAAFKFFERSSKRGFVSALENLAACYDNGWGIDRNSNRAAEIRRLCVHQKENITDVNEEPLQRKEMKIILEKLKTDRDHKNLLVIQTSRKNDLVDESESSAEKYDFSISYNDNDFNIGNFSIDSEFRKRPLHFNTNNLSAALKAYDRHYENLFFNNVEHGKEGALKVARQVLKELQKFGMVDLNEKNWGRIRKIIPFSIAAIYAVFSILKSGDSYNSFRSLASSGNSIDQMDVVFRPHTIQIIAIFKLLGLGHEDRMLRSYVMEVQSGEGKSIILGGLSLFFSILGCSVKCLGCSSHNIDKDRELFQEVFTAFGVKENIKYSSIKQMYDNQIKNNGDLKKLTVDMFYGTLVKSKSTNTRALGFFSRKRHEDKEILIVDDIDIFFGPEYFGKTHNILVPIYHKSVEDLLRKIWKERNETTIIDLKLSKEYKSLVRQFNWARFYFETELENMLNDARQFNEPLYEVNTVNAEIGYVSKDNFVDFKSRFRYRTSFAFLHEYENGSFKYSEEAEENLKKNLSLWVLSFKTSYALLKPNFMLGLATNLRNISNEERKVISQFRVLSYSIMPSIFMGKGILKVNDIQLLPDERRHKRRILDEMFEYKGQDRGVLIFFENDQKLNDFILSENIKNDKSFNFNILTRSSPKDERDHIMSLASSRGQVTFTTALFSSGSDFVSRDRKLDDLGGLHVIQTFFSREKYEEIKIKSCFAKQGLNGSYSMILSKPDLVTLFPAIRMVDSSITGAKLYQVLDKNRSYKYDSGLKSTLKEVQKSKSIDTNSKMYLDALNSGNLGQARKLFKVLNKNSSYLCMSSEYT